MSKNPMSPTLRWLRRLMLPLALLSSSAHAASYNAIWDPTFGSPFTNLGWRGTATYFVPDTCLPGGTADVNNIDGCDSQAIITSAQVDFYDATAGTDPPTITTLVFNPASMMIDTLRFVSGALTQLSASGADFVNPEADLSAFGVGSNVEFSLFFALDEDPLRSPRLEWQDCSYYYSYAARTYPPKCSTGVNDFNAFPATTYTITQVPEPGTLALACVALLAIAPRRVRAALWPRRT